MLKRFLILLIAILSCAIVGKAASWRPWVGNPALPTTEVYALHLSEERALYVGTDKGLFSARPNGKELKDVGLLNPYGQSSVTVRFVDGNIAISMQDVYELKGDKPNILRKSTEADLNQRSFTDSSGSVWHFDRSKPTFFITSGKDTLDIDPQLSGKIITDIAQIGKSRIAVSTNNDGIFILDSHGNVLENMRRTSADASGLPRNHVMGLCYDQESHILYAAIPQAGVWTCEIEPLEGQLVKTGIDEDISSIVETDDGWIWIGYDGGGIQILDRRMKQAAHFTQQTCSIPSDIITALYPTGENEMLASTYGKGVFRINRKGQRAPVDQLGETSPAAQCRSLSYDNQGCLWVATFTNGVVRLDTADSLHVFNTNNSALRTDFITDLKTSPKGDSVFVATGFGLYAFDAVTLKSAAIGEPLKIRQMTFQPSGQLILGTENGVTDRYGQTIALAGSPIKSVCADADGGLWCTTDSVLYYVIKEEVKQIALPKGTSFVNYALAVNSHGQAYAGGFGTIVIADSDFRPLPQPSSSSAKMWIAAIALLIFAIGLIAYCIAKRKPQARNQEEPSSADRDNTQPTSNDRLWLENIANIVQNKMSDSEFGVEQLSREVGMSRSNLYKKLSSLTGKTPQEYLRDMRIEEGKRLMEENNRSHIRLTMSEIAYKVGMSPRQFSKYIRTQN